MKNRMLWTYFKMVAFPFHPLEARGDLFSNLYLEDLVELLKVKLRNQETSSLGSSQSMLRSQQAVTYTLTIPT